MQKLQPAVCGPTCKADVRTPTSSTRRLCGYRRQPQPDFASKPPPRDGAKELKKEEKNWASSSLRWSRLKPNAPAPLQRTLRQTSGSEAPAIIYERIFRFPSVFSTRQIVTSTFVVVSRQVKPKKVASPTWL